MAEKKDERSLEMRVTELENKLGAQQMEFSEQEVAAYNKIAEALGVGTEGAHPISAGAPVPVCRVQPCRVQACRVQTCRVQTCRVQTCRVQTCRVQTCRVQQCIQQCINECVASFGSEFEGDLSGGFGMLGY